MFTSFFFIFLFVCQNEVDFNRQTFFFFPGWQQPDTQRFLPMRTQLSPFYNIYIFSIIFYKLPFIMVPFLGNFFSQIKNSLTLRPHMVGELNFQTFTPPHTHLILPKSSTGPQMSKYYVFYLLYSNYLSSTVNVSTSPPTQLSLSRAVL